MPQIHGHCDDRFAAVRTAFEANFRERGELGAAVTVRVGGETVADLRGGWADGARSRAWERDTLVNVWSTTKGATALCAHILADRGLLDFDAPVASYWPEFAAAGKEAIPVRHLLSHRAGLAGLREPHTYAELYDRELTCARLVRTESASLRPRRLRRLLRARRPRGGHQHGVRHEPHGPEHRRRPAKDGAGGGRLQRAVTAGAARRRHSTLSLRRR